MGSRPAAVKQSGEATPSLSLQLKTLLSPSLRPDPIAYMGLKMRESLPQLCATVERTRGTRFQPRLDSSIPFDTYMVWYVILPLKRVPYALNQIQIRLSDSLDMFRVVVYPHTCYTSLTVAITRLIPILNLTRLSRRVSQL